MTDAAFDENHSLVPVSAKKESSVFAGANAQIELGKPNSLRYNILTWVFAERYDKALEILQSLLIEKSVYPEFIEKSERLLRHSIDLVYAVRAKRHFPGMASLTRGRQQEMKEKYIEHLRELQACLMRIEAIRLSLRVKDARSTIYVVQAFWIALFVLLILGLTLELKGGMLTTFSLVCGDLLDKSATWVFELMGL